MNLAREGNGGEGGSNVKRVSVRGGIYAWKEPELSSTKYVK